MKTANQLVSDYWANAERDPLAFEKSFYLFPPIKSRSCQMIFNETDVSRSDWCEYWTVEKILKDYIPFNNALSICCGFGSIERSLSKLNVSKKIFGVDISDGAIKVAKEKAVEENILNIDYFTADLNTYDFHENEYDLIWANGALHHIAELESVINKLFRSLKPGGFMICNEYVGPNYYQFDRKQQVFIDALTDLMPESLKNNTHVSFKQSIKNRIKKRLKIKDSFQVTPIDWFLKNDPSEGVSSQDIIPVLKDTFNQIEVRNFGGTLLHFNEYFYTNFDYKNLEHREYLEFAFKLEDSLIESKILMSENAHIICRKDI
jgi:ubiquinone/menaquinone biosynthesis C-methylase UbiE